LREEKKAQRGGVGLGRLLKPEPQYDEFDMEVGDDAPVEPISDIVERLRFYSRDTEATVAVPTGSDEAAVEAPASSARAIDAD